MSYRFQDSNGGQAYSDAGMTSLPSSATIYDGSGNQVAKTTYSYDESSYSAGVTAGELTTTSRMLGSGSISTHGKFNSSGVFSGSIDAMNTATNVTSYDCSGLFPSGITIAAGTSVAENISYVHDCNTGKVTTYTDANSQATTYKYADSLNRLTSVNYPDGGEVGIAYTDTASPSVQTTTKATPNPNIVRTYVFDGLGRSTQTQLNSAPQGTIYTDTAYDGLGRISSISNPYQSASDSTYGFTSYSYDALGRKLLQCNPDNGTSSNACAAGSSFLEWDYDGNITNYHDELFNWSQYTNDGLGRLVKVFEPDPHFDALAAETDYQYDALSNLTQVTQWGGQTGTSGARIRAFTYDSLSHLITSTNPETGTICYGIWSGSNCINGYDANSNLVAKTDARGITTSYTYDALNRLSSKSYSGEKEPNGAISTHPTPTTCYLYDTGNNGATNTIGHLVAEWTQSGGCVPSSGVPSGAISWRDKLSYDAMGRINSEIQCQLSPCSAPGPMQYMYDLVGNLTYSNNGLANSQSPQVGWTRSYDSANRLSKIVSNWVDTNHPETLFEADQIIDVNGSSVPPYSPFGLTGAQYGIDSTTNQISLWEARSYDNRGRLISKNVFGKDGSVIVGTALLLSDVRLNLTANGYQAAVTVKNIGTGTRGNVTLTSVTLGSASGSPGAISLGTLQPGSSVTVVESFPGSVGAPGAMVVGTVKGTYRGGSFGSSFRQTLPGS